jgi:acyl-CoA hydrolase
MQIDQTRMPQFFRDCIRTPEDALRRTVRSGTRILTGFATSEPVTFYTTVWDFIRKEKVRDVAFRNALVLTPYKLFLGSALKSKGLLPGVADGLSLSLLASWARAINAATRKVESLEALIRHYERLKRHKVTFTSGFMSPVLNAVIPDTPMTRLMHPEYIGRNTSRLGLCDMQFLHFVDAADAMGFDPEGAIRADTFVAVMTPPDAEGLMSHGPSAACNGEILERILDRRDADVLLYVNPNYPFTRGLPDAPNTTHVDRFRDLAAAGRLHVVLDDGPVPAIPASRFDKPQRSELAIAEHVVNHMEANAERTHGRSLQVGFGGTGVLAVRKLKDSSWHGRCYTEMLEPFMLDLFESGKIAGSHIVERDGRRTMLDGKIVCTFALGTQGGDFYRRIDDNPAIVLAPSSRVVIPEGFFYGIGINNALAIDFNGHVNTSARDRNHYSGVGGGAAIVRGLARGGISYLCMKSTHTTPEGELRSSIFPFMPKGTPVCYTGPDMCGGREGARSYLVTEHGIAEMSGRSQADLIRALISVADPQFRTFLKRAAWREYRVRV